MTRIRYIVTMFVFIAMVTVTTEAVLITDLYNTGVDATGNVLSDYGIDTHYSITSPTGYIATAVPVDGYPIGTPWWVANSSQSRWIGPASPSNSNSYGPDGGLMTFSTSFSIANEADLSSVQVSGLIAADDTVSDVLLNGTSFGSIFSGFTTLQPFSLTSGFRAGTNTLDFVVQNSTGFGNANPTGLRIEDLSGSYDLTTPIPVPSSLILLSLGLSGTCFIRRSITA